MLRFIVRFSCKLLIFGTLYVIYAFAKVCFIIIYYILLRIHLEKWNEIFAQKIQFSRLHYLHTHIYIYIHFGMWVKLFTHRSNSNPK